jgi:hypothetical protein
LHSFTALFAGVRDGALHQRRMRCQGMKMTFEEGRVDLFHCGIVTDMVFHVKNFAALVKVLGNGLMSVCANFSHVQRIKQYNKICRRPVLDTGLGYYSLRLREPFIP